MKSLGTSFWKTSKVLIGHFVFDVFCFGKYVFFGVWAFGRM